MEQTFRSEYLNKANLKARRSFLSREIFSFNKRVMKSFAMRAVILDWIRLLDDYLTVTLFV